MSSSRTLTPSKIMDGAQRPLTVIDAYVLCKSDCNNDMRYLWQFQHGRLHSLICRRVHIVSTCADLRAYLIIHADEAWPYHTSCQNLVCMQPLPDQKIWTILLLLLLLCLFCGGNMMLKKQSSSPSSSTCWFPLLQAACQNSSQAICLEGQVLLIADC